MDILLKIGFVLHEIGELAYTELSAEVPANTLDHTHNLRVQLHIIQMSENIIAAVAAKVCSTYY